MHNVSVCYYHPSDYKEIKFRDKEEVQAIVQAFPYYFQNLHQICQGNVWSIRKDNKLVAIAGFITAWLGFAEVFLFVDEDFQHIFDRNICREIKALLNNASNRYPRLQTTCKANDQYDGKRNRRFLEFLGYRQEGLMKKYGINGEDMYLYSIINEKLS